MQEVIDNISTIVWIDIVLTGAWWVFFGRNAFSAVRCFFLVGACFATMLLMPDLTNYGCFGFNVSHFPRKPAAAGITGMIFLGAWVAIEIYAGNRRLSRLVNPVKPVEEEDPDKDLFDDEETRPD